MLARVDPREQEARATLRGWSARARTYARTNIKQMVIFGGVGFAVSWVLNVWVMASVYDGFRTPAGSPATGSGNVFQGALFYFFASALISSAISYRLLVGSERFWRELYAVPSNIKQAFTSDSDATLVHVLVGFSSGMLIVLIVGPSLAAALAFGTLLAFTPMLRPVVTGVLLTIYRWLVGRVAPKRTAMPPTVSMLVGVTGSIGAFALGGVLPTSSSLIVGLVAVVVAIIVAQRNKPSTSAILIALGAGVLAYWFGDVAIALADDGGMAECGNPSWPDWWSNCGGADTVRDQSLIGATFSALGSMFGFATGGSATADGDQRGPRGDGGVRSGPRPSDFGPVEWPSHSDFTRMSNEEQARFKKQLITQWRAENPHSDWAPLREMMSGLENPTVWERLAELELTFWGGVAEDVTSVEGWKRAGGVLVETPVKMIEIPAEALGFLSGYGVERTIDDLGTGLEKIGDKVVRDGWIAVGAEGKEMIEQAAGNWMDELQTAMVEGDEAKVQDMLSDVSGAVGFEILLGWAARPATMGGRAALESLDSTKDMMWLTKQQRMQMAMRAGQDQMERSWDAARSMKIRPGDTGPMVPGPRAPGDPVDIDVSRTYVGPELEPSTPRPTTDAPAPRPPIEIDVSRTYVGPEIEPTKPRPMPEGDTYPKAAPRSHSPDGTFAELDEGARAAVDPKSLSDADFQDWLEYRARATERNPSDLRIDPNAEPRSLSELQALPHESPITVDEAMMLTTASRELLHQFWEEGMRGGWITDLKMAGLADGQVNPRDMWSNGLGEAKPMDVKPKGWRGESDVAIGIKPPDGVPGNPTMYKLPTEPPGGVESPHWDAYQKRLTEFYDEAETMQTLQTEGLMRPGSDGLMERYWVDVDETGMVTDRKTGLPFYGDTDLAGKGRYEGTTLPSSEDLSAGPYSRNLSPEERSAIQARDTFMGVNEIKHPGDTLAWQPTKENLIRIRTETLEKLEAEGFVRAWKNGFTVSRK